MLGVAVLLYVGAFIYFYPLTFRFYYEQGRVKLDWLPRLCGGYAVPRPLWRSPADGRRTLAAAKRLRFYRPLIRRLLRHTVVNQLECRIQIGAADPFTTNMLAGLIMSSLGSLGAVALASVKSVSARPWLKVIPLSQGGLSGNLECIFHLRGGDIIGDALYYFWQKKGGYARDK